MVQTMCRRRGWLGLELDSKEEVGKFACPMRLSKPEYNWPISRESSHPSARSAVTRAGHVSSGVRDGSFASAVEHDHFFGSGRQRAAHRTGLPRLAAAFAALPKRDGSAACG